MDSLKINLVITDMDGTLLNSKGDLDESFYPLLERIREQKINFAVASGRQYFSLREKLHSVQKGLIFIAENGAIIMEDGEQKHLQPIARERALEVINTVKKIGGKYLVLCGRKSAYIEETDPEFMDPFLKHYEKYEVVPDLTLVEDDDILKITICDLSGAEENSYPHVKHLKGDFQVKLSGQIWIDFTHKDAQKGNALKKVQELKNISPEETISFGDYLNDIELFDHSHYSYAMENAHEEVKAAAKFSAKSNDDLGVLKVLEELLQSRENQPQKAE